MTKRKITAERDRLLDEKNRQELYEKLKTATPGKEARILHRELKRYGDGVSLGLRYPFFKLRLAICMSVLSIAMSLAGMFLKG